MFFFNLYIICSIIPRIHLDFFELFALIFWTGIVLRI
jgi:hypothetical protein